MLTRGSPAVEISDAKRTSSTLFMSLDAYYAQQA